jgi:hypothetical protein
VTTALQVCPQCGHPQDHGRNGGETTLCEACPTCVPSEPADVTHLRQALRHLHAIREDQLGVLSSIRHSRVQLQHVLNLIDEGIL